MALKFVTMTLRRPANQQQARNLMSVKNCALASLALSLALCGMAATARAADDGLISKPSNYSVKETVTRFEAAVKEKEAAGFVVFTEIDHADAHTTLGIAMG